MPVPERGWGGGPVRVCDACHRQGGVDATANHGEQGLLSCMQGSDKVFKVLEYDFLNFKSWKTLEKSYL